MDAIGETFICKNVRTDLCERADRLYERPEEEEAFVRRIFNARTGVMQSVLIFSSLMGGGYRKRLSYEAISGRGI